jgi:myo-inositol-1(or 4)-monophosphatase
VTTEARREEDLGRIVAALERAGEVIEELTRSDVAVERKANQDPVTVVDLEVDRVLRELLPVAGEGWLSEETADDRGRLGASRVWVVDPLDGTKEFVQKIPEWCVSVGLVEDGRAVAGGILNPAARELFVGAAGHGVTLNGAPVAVVRRSHLEGAVVLASRSELKRGTWARFEQGPIQVRPMGSVAYKLALVAAGRADATWSLAPKHEWDVAAGVALVEAAGGQVRTVEQAPLRFNQERPWLPGLVASHPDLFEATFRLLGAG